jgi:hypothetical protein
MISIELPEDIEQDLKDLAEFKGFTPEEVAIIAIKAAIAIHKRAIRVKEIIGEINA